MGKKKIASKKRLRHKMPTRRRPAHCVDCGSHDTTFVFLYRLRYLRRWRRKVKICADTGLNFDKGFDSNSTDFC